MPLSQKDRNDVNIWPYSSRQSLETATGATSRKLFVAVTVHARKKLLQWRQFARAPLSARAIALNYLELRGAIQDLCIRNTEFPVAEVCPISHCG